MFISTELDSGKSVSYFFSFIHSVSSFMVWMFVFSLDIICVNFISSLFCMIFIPGSFSLDPVICPEQTF